MAKVVSTTFHRRRRRYAVFSVHGVGALCPWRTRIAQQRRPPSPTLPERKSGLPDLRKTSGHPGRPGGHGGRSTPGVWRGSAPGSRRRRASTAKQSALIALRALHPILDPLVGGDARRRVHALGRKAHDVDDFRLALLLVEAVGPVCGLLDSLMAV